MKKAGFEVFHGGEYEYYRLLGSGTVCFGIHAPTFLKSFSPPSSSWKRTLLF
jgi:hypothetical protein